MEWQLLKDAGLGHSEVRDVRRPSTDIKKGIEWWNKEAHSNWSYTW